MKNKLNEEEEMKNISNNEMVKINNDKHEEIKWNEMVKIEKWKIMN